MKNVVDAMVQGDCDWHSEEIQKKKLEMINLDAKEARSNESVVLYFKTFKDALTNAQADTTIWRISFVLVETGELIHLVRDTATTEGDSKWGIAVAEVAT